MPQRLAIACALLALHTAQPAQRQALDARFIGNMAVAITDGTTTVISDFPYQSGYSSYMTYDAAEIRSATSATLVLITHRHSDHWEPSLFAKTSWSVAGPDDVVTGIAPARVVSLKSPAKFGAAQIEPIQTPHAGIGHYSYVVTWLGRRLYFSGDTESPEHLITLKNLDVAFVSPWLLRYVLKTGAKIDARQVVIYHHRSGERVAECAAACLVPRQGQAIAIR
jgi:L-ascorbate metabolism protein UlaG (beta-lactamase superfamily)